MTPKPEDLTRAVHGVLHSWHSPSLADSPWRDMLVVRQQLAAQLVPDLELAVKAVLLKALTTMEQQAAGAAARVLRLRFLDGLTARATANRLNLTENVVYKQQRTALHDLAAMVDQAERDARLVRAAGILERLEIQEPPRLFGIQDSLTALLPVLTAPQPPWLVAITGIGGIGKTALADAAARVCALHPAVTDVAWTSARQERFTLWRGLDVQDRPPALTLEGLGDSIAEQLGFRDLALLPTTRKQAELRSRLKALPYLVVVDNLETAADYQALVPALHGLVNPTRFLLTCRHSLHEYPGVYSMRLDELSAADSLSLLRHQAGERGWLDITSASEASLLPLYQVAGGNPLALELLLGQMHTLSLSRVVDDLRQARGQTVEELYRFIYWRSWSLLSDDARRVLAIMPLVAESGGGLDHIAELSTLPDARLTTALQQLVTFSLINVRGPFEARRYSVHRLTETFLLNEVLKWQTPA